MMPLSKSELSMHKKLTSSTKKSNKKQIVAPDAIDSDKLNDHDMPSLPMTLSKNNYASNQRQSSRVDVISEENLDNSN